MRKHLLVDFQHNRSILDHIDNNFSTWFSFSIVPHFLFGTTRRISLHYGHNLTFRNGRSFRDCTHITFRLISFAQLLQFKHWYIIILWFHCTIIFIEVAHHHCFSFVTTYFILLIFDLTSSLHIFAADQRFLFSLQIKISCSTGSVFIPLFCRQSFTHSFAVFFSHVCWWMCVSWCDCWSMICWWPISNEIASGISAYRLCLFNLCELLWNTSDPRCDFRCFIHLFWFLRPDSTWFI